MGTGDRAADLYESVRRCTGRLAAAGASGTGFFVAPGLVVTCAHVVAAAVAVSAPIEFQWQGTSIPAQVEQIVPPPDDAAPLGGYPYPDVAALSVAIVDHPCVLLTEADPSPGVELYAWGYTDEYPQGDSALFVLEGPTGNSDRLLKLKQAQARPGLSGAPLLDASRAAVTAMVKRSRDKASDLGARAIPASVIVASLAGVKTKHDAFHLAHAGCPSQGHSLSPSQRKHLEELLRVHTRNAEIYERQAAKFGPMAPVHILTSLEDERAAVRELQQRLGDA